MRSQRMDTGPGGRTECNRLLKQLHDMIPDFLEKIKIQVGMYRKIQHNPQEEIKSLYLCIEDTFYHLYLERERNTDKTITVIDDSRVLKDLLPEMGYRKEWDEKKYVKMLKRGKEIADTIKNSFSSKRNLTRDKFHQMRFTKNRKKTDKVSACFPYEQSSLISYPPKKPELKS
jgi:hypothetical protein